jgi:uncharacterized protein YfaS (alpha-2-macroglobulin family)
MDTKIKNVKITVEADDFFSITGGEQKQLNFTGTGDQLTSFELKVAEKTGIGRVKIIAVSGNERAEHLIEIGIRNPNQPVTVVTEAAIQPGKNWNTAVTAPGIAGTNRGYVELSSIPAMNLEMRLRYLITYPYGCIEQTVSAAFPQLYLSSVMQLTESEKRETEKNITSAINRLRSFQLADGAFSYWPGSSRSDDWGTSYAGHFLLEAEKAGYSMPVGWLAQWKQYQRQKANSWSADPRNFYYNDELVQAYRLYTLALARAPELGAMNRHYEQNNLPLTARWQLAAAYQMAGKKEVALKLISSAPTTVKAYCEMGGSYGSDLRDKALILETLTLLGLKTNATPLVKEIAASLCRPDWYSTQTTAFCLMAVSKYAGNMTAPGISATLQSEGTDAEEIKVSKSVITRSIDVTPGKKQQVLVTNTGKGMLFARIVTSGIPATGDTTAYANNLRISVIYKSMDGKIVSPIRLEQGTQFLAEVTLSNPGLQGKYFQLALSQVFPSGWEIINSRLSDLALSKSGEADVDHHDVRDDRVYTFFDLDPNRSRTITVMLMATWPGRYYQPPVSCSAMYDNTVTARVPGRWVEVVKGEK